MQNLVTAVDLLKFFADFGARFASEQFERCHLTINRRVICLPHCSNFFAISPECFVLCTHLHFQTVRHLVF